MLDRLVSFSPKPQHGLSRGTEMKVISKGEGDKLVAGLAQEIAAKKSAIPVIERTAGDPTEDANQSAATYWMLGWSWDEIEAILDDMGFPSELAEKALDHAKNYAEKTLTGGPFQSLVSGQGVKLANGDIGVVQNIFADHIDLYAGEDGVLSVAAEHIDFPASLQLREAYLLRKQAFSMVAGLEKPLSELKKKTHLRTVSEDILSSDIYSAMNRMSATLKSLDNLVAQAQEINEVYKTNGEKIPKTAASKEVLQLVFVTSAQEKDTLGNIYFTLAEDVIKSLNTLHDTLVMATSKNIMADPKAAKLINSEELSQFLNKDLPEVCEEVDTHIANLSLGNSRVSSILNKLARNEPATNETDTVAWANQTWEASKGFSNKWDNALEPKIVNGLTNVTKVISGLKSVELTAKIQSALV
jgi:hypothetical protein